ncbi:MAG: alpha-amylase [Candidatus Hydrogenedentes bacterium]|nr:alpha-amylase [Candidatus Hydrogenedentota bacterium]
MSDTIFEKTEESYFPFGFSLARRAWDAYQVASLAPGDRPIVGGEQLFALRMLASRMNEKHNAQTYPVPPVRAGQLVGLGLINEILRYVFDVYCVEENPGCLPAGFAWVAERHGAVIVEQPAHAFVHLYPPYSLLVGRGDEDAYVEGASPIMAHREVAAREMALLLMNVVNPAALPLLDLYDDAELKQRAPYVPLIEELDRFFATQPPFGPLGMTLFDILRAPILASPDSIEGQLDFMRERWAAILPDFLLKRLLLACDILREENLMRGLGPGPTQVLKFGRGGAYDYEIDLSYPEPARFTPDTDWMSNVVLIAKTVYVWLDQLSKKYQRAITRLDHIPDEELDRLSRWGFTGLWLIGVWERSPASQRIKQIMGNPEAVSSAYSLYDYAIAGDLGGDAAYQNLRDRAWRRGIRLASDMVPNHMGIYSKWVIEHPDWFIQLDYPPFPGYSFNGTDLSWDERVGLFIEDGYWDHRDAAVVFKRVDRWTGATKYIYHGNDGTSMPWNDTAQLNYLIPEVREAVIQTILHVARQFPIIRFDAAMTLAKKHYQRLWFPQPGDGGAIPSRAEHGLTKPDFDHVFPAEFWREVVDRVQQEVPDTLLLAEAFWLMEGYFVRTLGMHRVYNSAFMNMLKMEENSKYRMTVKNVLEFSPEVLKRFVNFMNNPDERTAVDQFGKEDKYYGVAALMVTMPGLPMFGHGQIEGFTEKYGMEYRRAYWDESVDEYMVARHEAEIFPLMRRRWLFSGVEHFAFFDFNSPAGYVDENVFAYSNRAGSERAIVCYNNAYTTTSGWIHTSVPMRLGTTEQDPVIRRSLGESLGLNTDPACYYIFRDHRSGLEYLRRGEQLAQEGLFVELHAYQYTAFIDFREVIDTDVSYGRLAARLEGRGVPSVEDAHRELVLAHILGPLRAVMNCGALLALAGMSEDGADTESVKIPFTQDLTAFLRAAGAVTPEEVTAIAAAIWADIELVTNLPQVVAKARWKKPVTEYLLAPLRAGSESHGAWPRIPIAWALCRHLGRLRPAEDYEAESASLMDEWLVRKVAAETFGELGCDPWTASTDADLIQAVLRHSSAGLLHAKGLRALVLDVAMHRYAQMNRYDGKLWVNKERFEQLVYWLFAFSVLARLSAGAPAQKGVAKDVAALHERCVAILNAAGTAGYQVEALLELLG